MRNKQYAYFVEHTHISILSIQWSNNMLLFFVSANIYSAIGPNQRNEQMQFVLNAMKRIELKNIHAKCVLTIHSLLQINLIENYQRNHILTNITSTSCYSSSLSFGFADIHQQYKAWSFIYSSPNANNMLVLICDNKFSWQNDEINSFFTNWYCN